MKETFSFQDLLKILRKRFVIIMSIMLVAVILSSVFTFLLSTPQYEASTQVLVNQNQNGEEPITSQELQSNREFINTYSVIMTSPEILEEVIEETNINSSVGELREKITVSSEEESQVAKITVQDADPKLAVSLVNSLTSIFEERIPEIMNIDNVSILSIAQLDNSNVPISPQPILNLSIATIIGLIIGTVFAFLLEVLDKTIKTEEDIENQTGLSILGTVPVMSDQDINNYKSKKMTNNLRSSRNQNF